MNKSTSQKTGGCKAAKFHTIEIRIPAAAAPLLAACAALNRQKPADYAADSLLASLKGEAESFNYAANQIFSQMEKGARQ